MSSGAAHEVREHPADGLVLPITLELSPLTGLLIIDIADDPTYRTLEPQILDREDGAGLLLLAYRHDGHVELYAEPHLEIDPSGYDGLEKGLAGIHRAVFDPGRFEVTDHGLDVDIAFTATNGRRVDLRLREHLRGPRDHFPLLAPVGGSFETPTFFPFLWLPAMSFVPARGTEALVRVDGQERSIERLPLPIGRRRCLMARYDVEAMVCQLNPTWLDEPRRTPAPPDAPSPDDRLDIVEVRGRPGLAGMEVRRGAHRCSVRLDPPVPDPRRLLPGEQLEGSVALQADGSTELEGRYALDRTGKQVTITIDRIGPWRTRQRRPLLGLLFRLPLFRRWPMTYRWHATIDLPAAAGDGWESRWSRCR